MRRKLTVTLSLLMFAGISLLPTGASFAAALPTVFTYQGSLTDTGTVANGRYDFRFSLYDAPSGGTKLAADFTVADLNVIDGSFTANIDFGSAAFSGNARWLEVAVRPSSDEDPDSYVPVLPRQMVTATPYALYAKTAGGSCGPAFEDVRQHGAKGDGITNDTAAFAAAISAAAGAQIYVPPGAYILESLNVTLDTYLDLSPAAVLKHRPNATGQMIDFNARNLRIRGGTIDGNKSQQTMWSIVVGAHLQCGKKIEISGTKFVNTVASAFYIQDFGGSLIVENCEFTGMAECNDLGGHSSCAIGIVNGQPDASGFIRISGCRFVADIPAWADGASPGGIFICTSDGCGFPGNMTTAEIEGCYFYGIGQHYGISDISPIHFYPTINGARVVNNYFEQCGFCAISAKSVQNFICADNFICNGQTTAKNIASEGAISYVPGYCAASTARPRATITGNIIDTPGGQTGVGKQACIAVHGIETSFANDVIIANNVLRNGGQGINANFVTNLMISDNIIEGASGGVTGTEHGIRIYECNGSITVSGNQITTRNGFGLICTGDATGSRWYVVGNTFDHSSAETYACTLRGMDYLKFSANTFNAMAGSAVIITHDYASNPVRWLAWDSSNTVSGPVLFNWTSISKATGFLMDAGSPCDRVTPGEIGTLYRQTDAPILWQSQGTTKTSWVQLRD